MQNINKKNLEYIDGEENIAYAFEKQKHFTFRFKSIHSSDIFFNTVHIDDLAHVLELDEEIEEVNCEEMTITRERYNVSFRLTNTPEMKTEPFSDYWNALSDSDRYNLLWDVIIMQKARNTPIREQISIEQFVKLDNLQQQEFLKWARLYVNAPKSHFKWFTPFYYFAMGKSSGFSQDWGLELLEIGRLFRSCVPYETREENLIQNIKKDIQAAQAA